jgi:hypothetical protein
LGKEESSNQLEISNGALCILSKRNSAPLSSSSSSSTSSSSSSETSISPSSDPHQEKIALTKQSNISSKILQQSIKTTNSNNGIVKQRNESTPEYLGKSPMIEANDQSIINSIANKVKVNSKLVINDSIKHYKANNSKLTSIARKAPNSSNWYNDSTNPVEIYSQIEDADHYENIDDLGVIMIPESNQDKYNRVLSKTNEIENDTSEDNEDINEDDEVVIDDYSCFQLNSPPKIDEYMTSLNLNTKTLNQANANKSYTRSKASNLIDEHSTASSTSISTSTSSLPPLPRQPQPHSLNTSNSPSFTSPINDFDRSLHCRRSNRYLRQLTPNNLVVQDININTSSSSHITSPPTLNSIKENSTDNLNQKLVTSTLTKAVSVPSLIDNSENLKVNIGDNGDNIEETTLVECKLKQSISTLSLKVDEANGEKDQDSKDSKRNSTNEVVERKFLGKNGKKNGLIIIWRLKTEFLKS